MPKSPQSKVSKAKAATAPMSKRQLQKVQKPKNKAHEGTAAAQSATANKLTKSSQCLALLRRGDGVSIAELMTATGWQSHSVRGFLSGAVKRKLGLTVTSAAGEDGIRRYHVAGQEA